MGSLRVRAAPSSTRSFRLPGSARLVEELQGFAATGASLSLLLFLEPLTTRFLGAALCMGARAGGGSHPAP